MPEDQRRALVESLKVVDEAILGYEELDISRAIETIRPDIIAVGHDQGEIERKCEKRSQKRGLTFKS